MSSRETGTRGDGDADTSGETSPAATDGAGVTGPGSGTRESVEATEGRVETAADSTLLAHPAALLVGVVAVAVGVGTAVGVAVLPVPPERPAVTATAAALVVLAAALGIRRARTPVEQADPPVVESRGEVAVPGSSFDADLATAVEGGFARRNRARQAIAERLRETAASVLAVTDGLAADRASERVAGGEWPPDVDIDAVLGEDEGWVNTDRLLARVGRRSAVERETARVVDALVEATPGLERRDEPPSSGSPPSLPTEASVEPGADADGETGTESGRTRRWTGVAAVAALAVGVGAFATFESGSPSLVVAAAAVVGAAGYAAFGSVPSAALAVERRVEADRPDPGEEVEVTVTVENAGEGWLTDLRVVDGVPAGLRVVDGSPRYATALRPGESVRFSYVVEATRGGHTFDPLLAVARDASGATECERRVEATGTTDLTCVPDLDGTADVPVFAKTGRRTGRVRTDTGGAGVEFHSVRDYRRGDPLNRVDWNRVAATGELATLQFHEERAATVVVVVDAREPAYVTADPDGVAVPDLQLRAADRVAASLLDAGDSVGLAAFSPEWCWLEPRGGDTQRSRIRKRLATHPAFAPDRPTEPYYGRPPLRRLRAELPGDAQLVVLSPLCDDRVVALLREFHARGYPVTVVSPDATRGASTGQRLAAVERALRLSELRRSGVRVVDWDTDTPLTAALDAADRRWSG